jgi:hypothetical protein
MISVRNIVLPDEIQKKEEEIDTKFGSGRTVNADFHKWTYFSPAFRRPRIS